MVVHGGTSDWLTVTSGVPQGSILGPLFFIIYINDLPGVVSDGNKIVLYADDSKLYKVIHSVHAQECFQWDLNKINEWCVNNKMRINASKCKVMRITKKKSPFTYDCHINGAKLNSVSLHRDLGLLTSDVLSWNFHIANITAKANSILGLIKRTCRDVNDVTTLKTLYCSLVRPRVEYASQVWNPYSKGNISRIESIQRRATKFILKSDDEYLVRLRKLRLLSLEDRRFMADVVFFYKVVSNHVRLTLDFRVRFSRDVDRGYALRSMDTPNLLTSLSRTNLLKFSFMKRIVEEWNSLPLDTRGASSVEDFKLKVSTFLTLRIFVYIFLVGI